MPEIKEKWEEAFEEYCNTLVSLGATIKNEKALKMAYKIYREKIPERIYKTCVDENIPHPQQKEELLPKENAQQTTKEEKKPEKKEKPQPLKSLDSLSTLKDSLLSEEKEEKEETPKSPTISTKTKQEEKKVSIPTPKKPENTEPKKRLTQRERFDNYISNLEKKGIIIKNKDGLWETFRTIRGRLDYKQISEFVIFPKKEKKKENKREESKKKPEKNKNITPPQPKENKKTEKKGESAQIAFEKYRQSLFDKGYEITDVGALARIFVANNGFVGPEDFAKLIRKKQQTSYNQASISDTFISTDEKTTLPAVVEHSFADKWLKPIQEHCQKDLDSEGKPKRNVNLVKADKHSVIIDVVPSAKQMKQHPNDEGARYSFRQIDKKGNVDINMGSKSGKALDYEYFRMVMEANRKNGIKTIIFKDIKTEEFRDKLLAAALEYDMKLKGAPKNININAAYLKDLPSNVKYKLGVYNGDLKPEKTAEELKEILRKKKHPENTEKKPQKPLALPAHISPKEKE